MLSVARAGAIVFAGNDDYIDSDTVVWIDPPGPGRNGALWIGPRDNVQHGFNDKGLAYDANGLPAVGTRPHPERTPVDGGYTAYPIQILRDCATVEEVIAWVQGHRWHERMWDQLHFADRHGDAVVIGAGRDGELVFTRKVRGDGYLVSTNFNLANPSNGDFPCWRYDLATRLLDEMRRADDLNVARVAAVMDAVHVASPAVWTKVTFVADLATRSVTLYYFHQFDHPVTLRVDEEVARGRPDTSFSALFPPEAVSGAEAIHQRLTATRARARLAALAWLATVAACVVIVWLRGGIDSRERRIWGLAALVLGPVALAAWVLATSRVATQRWPCALQVAARVMAPYVAGTVLALAAVMFLGPVMRSTGLQFLAFYGLPLVFGLALNPAGLLVACESEATSSRWHRLREVLVAGHLTLAGVWLVVMMSFSQIVRMSGVGLPAVGLGAMAAATGAALGGALLVPYVGGGRGSVRDSWWLVAVTLLVLLASAVLGGALGRLVAAMPALSSLVSAA